MGIELVHRAFHDEKLGKQISAHLEKALQKSSLNGAAPGQSPDGVSIQVVLEQHKREVDETLQDEYNKEGHAAARRNGGAARDDEGHAKIRENHAKLHEDVHARQLE